VEGGVQTNNRGELSAILNALRILDQRLGSGCADIDLTIYTDSDYSKSCLTKWVPGWVRKGWVTSSNTPVLNRDLIEAALALQPKFHSVTYEYVRAHTGAADEHSRHNDRVDRMARRIVDPTVTLPEEKEIPVPSVTVLEGCPLRQLGPPVSVQTLTAWAKEHLDQLDQDAVSAALLKALKDTFSKKNLKLESRKGMVSLTSGLHVESAVVTKDE